MKSNPCSRLRLRAKSATSSSRRLPFGPSAGVFRRPTSPTSSSPRLRPIVEHNPNIDELIVAPRPSGIGRLRSELELVRRLRAAAYDIAIDFHSGPRASILTWLSGAPVRVGYTVVGRSWMYTRLIARPRELRPRHSVENQWDLLAALDIGPPDRIEYPVEMPLDDRTASALAERLVARGRAR